MRRTLAVAVAAVAALVAVALFGFRGATLQADGCSYRGEENALPTAGLPIPVLVYGNATTTPTGFVGLSQGSALTYAQISTDGSSGQVEANAAPASESIWVNTDGNTGPC